MLSAFIHFIQFFSFHDYIAEVHRFSRYLVIIFLYELMKNQRMFILFQGLYSQRNVYIFSWITSTLLLCFCGLHSMYFVFLKNFVLYRFHLLLCSRNFAHSAFCLYSGLLWIGHFFFFRARSLFIHMFQVIWCFKGKSCGFLVPSPINALLFWFRKSTDFPDHTERYFDFFLVISVAFKL